MSDFLQPQESQHARPPCLSPTPGVHSNSHPLSRWCHPAISSSVVPFSSCPQSLPASGSFPMCQLFAWGVQSLFSMSVSLFLLYKRVHQYHFSRFHICALIHDILSFWLTSLCITGSWFIHLTKIDSNDWIVVPCICVQLLYPFICRWTSRLRPCPSNCK